MSTRTLWGIVSAACCTFAASGQVTIQFHWSLTGVAEPAAADPNERDFVPFFQPFADPGQAFQPATNPVRLFVWGTAFGPDIEEFDTRVIGVQTDIVGTAAYEPGLVYRQRRLGQSRWSGLGPIALDGGVAGGRGILLLDADTYDPNETGDLSTGRSFVYGSLLVWWEPGEQIGVSSGPLGVEVKIGSAPSFQATTIGDTLTFIPEPAAVGSLAALLMLRRPR